MFYSPGSPAFPAFVINGTDCVIRECPALHEMVDSLDALARFCRKSKQRRAFLAPTRTVMCDEMEK
jgi:hypothetical protein